VALRLVSNDTECVLHPRSFGQLVEEARLAGARITHDDCGRRSVAACRQHGFQGLELLRPADE
jgi:hypothetical protein